MCNTDIVDSNGIRKHCLGRQGYHDLNYHNTKTKQTKRTVLRTQNRSGAVSDQPFRLSWEKGKYWVRHIVRPVGTGDRMKYIIRWYCNKLDYDIVELSRYLIKQFNGTILEQKEPEKAKDCWKETWNQHMTAKSSHILTEEEGMRRKMTEVIYMVERR